VFLLANNNTGMQDVTHIIHLLKTYLNGTLELHNSEELQELFEAHPDLMLMLNRLKDPEQLQNTLNEYKKIHTVSSDRRQQLLGTILNSIATNAEHSPKRGGMRKTIYRYVAVACMVAAVITGIWKIKETIPTNSEKYVFKQAEKLGPGGNKAILMAADGTTITLNEDHDGIVIGDDITYDDGSVLLRDQSSAEAMMTLATPKGGQYQIVLPDGTKVWLNADTRLKYPKRFLSDQRRVELEGEAYFEVASNKAQPFIVITPMEQVEVVGTHFNVHAYTEETLSKVALLEGKVKVSVSDSQTMVLQPGQQTVVQGNEIRVLHINPEESIAWKNGEFMFNNENLGTALKQIARWYDIHI
jgi:ferric-dicitrate binding protein FerR (iron transport regulator)